MAATKENSLTTYVGHEKAALALTYEDQVNLLSIETPPHYIKQREGRGGRTFDYVEANYVQGRLNATFRFKWDVEIIERVVDTKGNQIAMWIRLTVYFIDGSVVKKDAWGSAEIKRKQGDGGMVDLADDLKAAQSDGIKKAASMLGICWDVYSGYSKTNDKAQQAKPATKRDPLDDSEPEPIIDVNAETEPNGDDLADLASGPEPDLAELNTLVDKIRHAVDAEHLEYPAFKVYLGRIQDNMEPPRMFVGKKFGNLALTEGKLEDLKVLDEKIDTVIAKFKELNTPQETTGEQPSLI